jgi:hypothetical protein
MESACDFFSFTIWNASRKVSCVRPGALKPKKAYGKNTPVTQMLSPGIHFRVFSPVALIFMVLGTWPTGT